VARALRHAVVSRLARTLGRKTWRRGHFSRKCAIRRESNSQERGRATNDGHVPGVRDNLGNRHEVLLRRRHLRGSNPEWPGAPAASRSEVTPRRFRRSVSLSGRRAQVGSSSSSACATAASRPVRPQSSARSGKRSWATSTSNWALQASSLKGKPCVAA
jgi:hypothetical protein